MNHIFYGTVIILLYFILYPTTICCQNVSTNTSEYKENEARSRIRQMERNREIWENSTKNCLRILNDVDFDVEMTPAVNEFLNKTDSMKMRLDAKRPLSRVAVEAVHKKINLLWTYNSNAIEGNVFTLKETRTVVEGLLTTGNYLRERTEVKNHYEAIDYVESVVRDQRALSEVEIREINFLILKNIRVNEAGKYREVDVYITNGVSDPPSPEHIHQLMANLLSWYHNTSIHPIKKVAIFHARFEMIHPFMDGNGRTGRLIVNLELMKVGYPPAIIQAQFKNEYYSALNNAFLYNSYDMMTLEVAIGIQYVFRIYSDALHVNI